MDWNREFSIIMIYHTKKTSWIVSEISPHNVKKASIKKRKHI